jgi:hypothetical protein
VSALSEENKIIIRDVATRIDKPSEDKKHKMSEVDTYIKENAEVHQFAAEIARIISGIPQMPEFSSESMSVSDASQLIGLPVTSIRAGIVYGWLPIGVAVQNNKPAKSLSGGRITYIISPRKVYEVTGHVWKGKAALNK